MSVSTGDLRGTRGRPFLVLGRFTGSKRGGRGIGAKITPLNGSVGTSGNSPVIQKLSQKSRQGRNRSPTGPHPVPLPKGEGTRKAASDGSLSPRERVGVRAMKFVPLTIVARFQPHSEFWDSLLRSGAKWLVGAGAFPVKGYNRHVGHQVLQFLSPSLYLGNAGLRPRVEYVDRPVLDLFRGLLDALGKCRMRVHGQG
jgi:hypothetical protein